MSDIIQSEKQLTGFVARLLTAMGTGSARSQQWADVLVWADLHGVPSHGIAALPHYRRLIVAGDLDPAAPLEPVAGNPAADLIDAHRAPGHVALREAADRACFKARSAGTGFVVVRKTTHTGAVGYFADHIARAGMTGLVLTAASLPAMAYPGIAGNRLSTNPIAIGIPRAGATPLLLDMATSTTAGAKVIRAMEAGEAIPRDWGVDASGQATTDPGAVEQLTSCGGDKGALLSFMIEAWLCSLAGEPLLEPVLRGEAPTHGSHAIALAVDPDGLAGRDRAARLAAGLADAMLATPAAEETAGPRLPGERRYALAATRRRNGVPVSAATWKNLSELAADLGVAVPLAGVPSGRLQPETEPAG